MQRFMQRSQGASTDIMCPAGCGGVVETLRATEAIFTTASSQGATHNVSGECPGCGEEYRLPVTRQSEHTRNPQ